MGVYMVFKDVDGDISSPIKTDSVHQVGDVITWRSYSERYKCVEITECGESTTYIFKQVKKVYTYNW
jgi:hypothetical protein